MSSLRERISSARRSVEQDKGKRDQISGQIEVLKESLRLRKRDLKRHEKANEIVKAVAIQTQKQIQFHISDIATMALRAVFDDPYELSVEFVQRRNKTECDLQFVRGDDKIDPISAAGGGAVDVASFALRVASWAMERPHSRNTLILDEPFRYLSVGLLPKASEMLQRMSKEMNLQIIMVTHSEELIDRADKVFTVSKNRKGISKVD